MINKVCCYFFTEEKQKERRLVFFKMMDFVVVSRELVLRDSKFASMGDSLVEHLDSIKKIFSLFLIIQIYLCTLEPADDGLFDELGRSSF
jgi:hypothetical protein